MNQLSLDLISTEIVILDFPAFLINSPNLQEFILQLNLIIKLKILEFQVFGVFCRIALAD